MAATGNPIWGNNSSVLLKKEGTPGTREPLTTGAAHLDLISEDTESTPQILQLESPIGDRQQHSGMRIVTHEEAGGTVIFRPRAQCIDQVLELMFGLVASEYWVPEVGNTDLDRFTCEVNKFGLTEYAYTGCRANSLKLMSEQNGPLNAELNFLATSAERNPGDLTTPVYTTWNTGTPFMHKNLVVNATGYDFLGGASGLEVKSYEVTISNNLDADAFCNSANRSLMPIGALTLQGSLLIPYNAVTDGYLTAWAAGTKFKYNIQWEDAALNNLELEVAAEIDGEGTKVESEGEHKWLNLVHTGMIDVTDTNMVKMKYTAVV